MGTWGYEPWESDEASDWFFDLISAGFVNKIEKALAKDEEEYAETIRAASYVVRVLALNFVWPHERLEKTLRLAVGGLTKVLDAGVLEDSPTIVEKTREELRELEERLAKLRLDK